MSFGENLGTGTLADGFIASREPDALRTYYYELEIDFGGQGQAVVVRTLTEWDKQMRFG